MISISNDQILLIKCGKKGRFVVFLPYNHWLLNIDLTHDSGQMDAANLKSAYGRRGFVSLLWDYQCRCLKYMYEKLNSAPSGHNKNYNSIFIPTIYFKMSLASIDSARLLVEVLMTNMAVAGVASFKNKKQIKQYCY